MALSGEKAIKNQMDALGVIIWVMCIASRRTASGAGRRR
jgi:hypothetical protein